MTGVLIKRGNTDTETCREGNMQWENIVKRHKKKMAVYKPRKKSWKVSSPHSPQKEPTPLAFWVSNETIHFCYLSHSVYVTLLYSSPCKLIQYVCLYLKNISE